MFLQTDLIDKIRIGIQDVLWPLVTEGPDQNGYDALGDDGITVSGEQQSVPLELGMYPYPALTTLDQIVVRLVPLLDQGKGLAQFNHIFIALHPVFKHGKFVDYAFLYFLYRHLSDLIHGTPFRSPWFLWS